MNKILTPMVYNRHDLRMNNHIANITIVNSRISYKERVFYKMLRLSRGKDESLKC